MSIQPETDTRYTSLELCEWSQVEKKSRGHGHIDGNTQVTRKTTDKEEWRIEEGALRQSNT